MNVCGRARLVGAGFTFRVLACVYNSDARWKKRYFYYFTDKNLDVSYEMS